jgi:radical SAM protein with 4Fe4S-binding SPASM domain
MAGSRGAERILNDDKTQFQKEQNDLLKFVLNERWFKPWSLPSKQEDREGLDFTLYPESKLEIYVTAVCNQHCEYCYLVKNAKGLYPREYDKKDTILKNLEKLYDWVIKNNYTIPSVEFFSGEIWHNEYGLEVLDISLEALKRGMQVDQWLIPSNCSFVLDKNQTARIQKRIDAFMEMGSPLVFSISVDGGPVENQIRGLNSGVQKTDEFYDDLFTFAQHNNFNFHPMVAACDIDKWIENYIWWEDMCAKYDIDIERRVMMLEVRNNDWTPEAIEHYNKFMNALMLKRYKTVGESAEAFTKDLFCIDGCGLHGYVPYAPAVCDTFAGCTVCNSLTVRLGDMAICPCHRTAYNKFLYGWFQQDEEGNITDIVANNPQMAVRILMTNFNVSSFKCDTCPFSYLCIKGCYGAQFEEEQDPFMPIEGVCNFFKQKWINLIHQYEKYGVIDYLQTIPPYTEAYERVQEFLNYVREVKMYEMGLSVRSVSIRDCID